MRHIQDCLFIPGILIGIHPVSYTHLDVYKRQGFNSDDHVALSERIQSALKEFFRPEFLNRIDEIITFEPLTKPQLRRIVDLMLKDVYRSGQYQNIHIEVADEVKELSLIHI